MFNPCRIAAVMLAVVAAGAPAWAQQAPSVGEQFCVSMRSNPSTGYQWELVAVPDGLAPLGSTVEANTTGMVGAPTTQVFTFKALKAGLYSIPFVYKRPWEPAPIQSCQAEVEVVP